MLWQVRNEKEPERAEDREGDDFLREISIQTDLWSAFRVADLIFIDHRTLPFIAADHQNLTAKPRFRYFNVQIQRFETTLAGLLRA
jgi:hypothetical protein